MNLKLFFLRAYLLLFSLCTEFKNYFLFVRFESFQENDIETACLSFFIRKPCVSICSFLFKRFKIWSDCYVCQINNISIRFWFNSVFHPRFLVCSCFTRSSVFCVMFVDHCLSYCNISSGHCIIFCTSTFNGFLIFLIFLYSSELFFF